MTFRMRTAPEHRKLQHSKKDRHWPPHVRAVSGSFISLALFALAISKGPLPILDRRSLAIQGPWLRILLVVTAIVICSWLYRHDWKRLIANSKNDYDPAFQPDERWLVDLQKHITTDFSKLERAGVLTFIDLLAYPARYRSRVSETVDFAERGLNLQVSVELAIPPAALDAKLLYLPVLFPLKGELLDNFRLYDQSGASLPNLSYVETTRLAGVGLRYLLASSDSGPGPVVPDDVAVDELLLLGPVARRGVISATTAAREIDERLNELSVKVSSTTRERLRAYLTLLSTTYPIVIAVPPEATANGRVLVKYERTVIPVAESKGIEGKIRLALGTRPRQVAIPVDLSATSGSYHLRINGPNNQYVFRQYLRCRHCGALASRAWTNADLQHREPCRHTNPDGQEASRTAHFRLRQRRGQSYVHLYMRGYANEGSPRDLEFLARLKEVPPGSLANAVATALVTTLLITVAGYISVRNADGVHSDLPALILALPVAAASWLGISEDSGKVIGSSLLARISLIWSGLLSICSIIAYLALRSTLTNNRIRETSGQSFAIVGIHNWIWMLLIGTSFLNLAYTAFRFSVRTTYYNYLRRKPSSDAAEYGS